MAHNLNFWLEALPSACIPEQLSFTKLFGSLVKPGFSTVGKLLWLGIVPLKV
ncbi:hypothetical protein [Fulvivirga kasyanovii]|uniref:hypothetical protein n=1 Tax=Fulvivirga kasyanovii TaxID=396812 RepID=UPI0031D632DB